MADTVKGVEIDPVREKLVELLDNFHRDLSPFAGNEKLFMVDDNVEQAEYLIAHGVTVQEWISVKERLPKIDTQVLCFTGSSVQLAMYEGNDKWFTNYHSYTLEGKNLFTNWMPLPQPPMKT